MPVTNHSVDGAEKDALAALHRDCPREADRLPHGFLPCWWRRTCVTIVGVFVSLFLLTLGGFLESRWFAYSTFRQKMDDWMRGRSAAVPERFDVKADPGWVDHASRVRPDLPRPRLESAGSILEWQRALRLRLRQRFELPDALPSPGPVTRGPKRRLDGGIVRQFVEVESWDGANIPAYLFVPPGEGAKPAVIVLHGHVRPRTDEGISQLAGLYPSYHNGAARRLCQAGFVTLAMEFRGFGYLGRRVELEHRFIAYNAILSGTFYKSLLARDILAVFQWLRAHEEVDPQRMAVSGVSFGGEMAVTYAAMDPRVKVVVVQESFGTMGPKPGKRGVLQRHQPHYCHLIPGENRLVHREDWLLLVAPRPLLAVWKIPGRSTWEREASMYKPLTDCLQNVYSTLNAESMFQWQLEMGGHEYFVEPAIKFLHEHL